MSDVMTRVRGNAAVLGRRARLRLEGVRPVGYVGAASIRNLGDRAAFDGAVRAAPSVRWLQVEGPVRERRLAHLGLSGRPMFRSIVLGGGTMMNDYTLATVRAMQRFGLRCRAFGTGVGSAGWGMDEESAARGLRQWVPLLREFDSVAVRGPLSVRRLAEAGFEGAEVVGDLALALTLPSSKHESDGALWVNLIPKDEREDWDPGLLPGIRGFIEAWLRAGRRVVPFAMDDLDVGALRLLEGLPTEPIAMPTNAEELIESFSRASGVLSMRLHGTVLGVCAGAPVVPFAYRDKVRDFLSSVDGGGLEVDVHSRRHTLAFDEVIGARFEEATARATAIHARALELQARLRLEGARIGDTQSRQQSTPP